MQLCVGCRSAPSVDPPPSHSFPKARASACDQHCPSFYAHRLVQWGPGRRSGGRHRLQTRNWHVDACGILHLFSTNLNCATVNVPAKVLCLKMHRFRSSSISATAHTRGHPRKYVSRERLLVWALQFCCWPFIEDIPWTCVVTLVSTAHRAPSPCCQARVGN